MAWDYPSDLKIYTKADWADAWVERTTLRAVRAQECVAPAMPFAIIRQDYGKIKREAAVAFAAEAPLSLRNYYVKIASATAGITWVGVIAQENHDLQDRGAENPTGLQDWTAYGLEHLLDFVQIDGAWCDDEAGGTEHIDAMPTFNYRNRRGGSLLGNRKTAQVAGTWVFSRDAAIWTVKNMIEYCLDEASLVHPFLWLLGGLHADLDQLDNHVVNVEGLTVRQALNKLIDRRRGYSWCVQTTGAGNLTVKIFSIFDSDVVVGGDTYHQNADQTALDVSNDIEVKRARVNVTSTALFNSIRAKGARVKSCFTAAFADSTLEAAWSAAEEGDYLNAASGAADYLTLTVDEQGIRNDTFRGNDTLRRVFTTYRIPPVWDWQVGDGLGGPTTNANPEITDDGDVDTATTAAALDFDRPILPWTPLQEGLDYSLGAFPEAMAANAEARFRAPFAILYDDNGMYRYAHELGDPDIPDARVQAADREMALNVEFKPAHLLARFHWAAAEPSWWPPAYDHETLIATVCVETDEHLAVVENAGGAFPEYANQLVIQVPEAELWYVADGTVVGIDADGALQHIAGGAAKLRDDSGLLRAIAKLALQWYSTPRAEAIITKDKLEDLKSPGDMITTITGGAGHTFEANAVVTKQAWDFTEARTTIELGWWQMDWHRIASVNTPGHTTTRDLVQTARNVAGALAGIYVGDGD